MECFRNHIVMKVTTILLMVVLQLDMLDYIKGQVTIPAQISSELVVQDADGVQEDSDDSSLSLQRIRNLKKIIRTRVLHCSQNWFKLLVLDVERYYPSIVHGKWTQQEHCPLLTLFCIFRI